MSGSDRRHRKQERAAREARRAQRLAEREKLRAERKAEEARAAAERASVLAEKASQTKRKGQTSRESRRRHERSLEDYVDDFTEKWEKKAEAWFEDPWFKDQGRAIFGTNADEAAYDAYDYETEMGTGTGTATETVNMSTSRSRRPRSSRRHGSRSHRRRSLRSRFNSGRGLYRDKERGKICGVCAGAAEYLEIATWQVRLVAVMGLIFVPSVAITVYFITYFLMDDKPYYRRVTDRYKGADTGDDFEDDDDPYNPDDADTSRGHRSRMSNTETLRTAKDKFADIEVRLRSMESHVTSSKFELQRELRKIAGEDA